MLPNIHHTSITTMLHNVFTPTNPFFCDNSKTIVTFTHKANIPIHVLPTPRKPSPETPHFHLNNVNTYHPPLKEYMRLFHASPPKTYPTTCVRDEPWKHRETKPTPKLPHKNTKTWKIS